MNARVWLAGLLLILMPPVVMAQQDKIAVVNIQQAILLTDVAQQRLQEFETSEDFASDKAQADALRADLAQLVKDFQRDQAAMSEEDQVAAQQKMASKQSDFEYVAKKLQALAQQVQEQVIQELAPQAQEVLKEVIAADQIGLLLQAQSVYHASISFDITAKVTDKMNQLGAE